MKTGMKIIAKIGILSAGMVGFSTNAVSAAYFDSAPAPRCAVQLSRELRFGSEGVDVSVLQDFLNRAGYLSVVPNGHFGPATKTAVRAFQAHNFISATGNVGPVTLNAINERMCDTDLRGDAMIETYSSGHYGVSTGVTYVDPFDPFVRVITPQTATPVVYANPQNVAVATGNQVQMPAGAFQASSGVAVPASASGIASTNVIYSPSIGYTYGITPASGSLTVVAPQVNASYAEGQTVQLSWSTNNINATGFTILLENASTNQSRVVTAVSGNSASFVLTKELLDAVCAGSCSPTNQNSYRIVITTPIRDIAGNVTTLRAAVQPVTIVRPFNTLGTINISTSKTPVNSGEVFKLYITVPSPLVSGMNSASQYSFRIRVFCPSGVTASMAGVPCGQDFSVPYNSSYFPSEIPVMIGNSTWLRQDVAFTLTAINAQGQAVASATTTVQVNATPFNF